MKIIISPKDTEPSVGNHFFAAPPLIISKTLLPRCWGAATAPPPDAKNSTWVDGSTPANILPAFGFNTSFTFFFAAIVLVSASNALVAL